MNVCSIRLAVRLTCLVSAVGLAATAATAATAAVSAEPVRDGAYEQPFAADSGDACRYGQVRGTLTWFTPPLGGRPTAVDVTGVLRDHPPSPVTTPECPDDRRFSVVTLTAFAGGERIDAELVRADNGARRFEVSLTNEVGARPIDFVTVEVCRQSLVPGQLTYCGPVQRYPSVVSLAGAH